MPIDKNGIFNGVKTKNLVIIFILFLLITLTSGLLVFLTGEKGQSVLRETGGITNYSNQPVAVAKKQVEIIKDNLVSEKADEVKPIVRSGKTAPSDIINKLVEEKIRVVIIINGTKYATDIKSDSSVYDLMSALKEQKEIDFKGKDYSGVGFFIEEINGVKNNPSGKNWLYYINSQPAQVGVSYYKLKNNDTIEWKYENKSF